METCYKVFRSDVLKRLRLVSNRFGIEPEMTAKVARLGARVYEVPISYHGREYWEGKKIGWKDGVAAIWTIARCALIDDSVNTGPTTRRTYATPRYNDWLWSRVAPLIGDRVLEIGSGTGNFTRYLRNHALVVATESNPHQLEQLRSRFRDHDTIRVEPLDWIHNNSAPPSERFDSVLCLDELAAMERDDEAFAAFARVLGPGGRLILQVPASRWLYGETDRAIGYIRRYDRDELTAKLARHGFSVETARYVNLPGALVWYLNARLLRRRTVPALQARIVSALVPWLRVEERLNPRWGMSLLAVARKDA
jgi:SAM-dependent methyltransferase